MNNTQHPLDDLFRRELTDLEISPTPAGRSGFLKKAEKELNKRSYRSWWFIGSGIAIILLFIGGIVLFDKGTGSFRQDEQGSGKSNAVTGTKRISSPGQTPASSLNHRPDISGKNTPSNHSSASGTGPGNPAPDNMDVSPVTQIDTYEPTEPKAINLPPRADDVSMNAAFEESNIQTNINRGKSDPIPTIVSLAIVNNDSIPEILKVPVEDDTLLNLIKKSRLPRSKEWNFAIGIYYTPEWIFNTLDSNKYVNNFGLEGTFHFGPYSVRTGLGLSVSKGYNQVVIETKPYLGGYHSLDYITYQWDENHYHLVPTIYTSWRDVFDTVLQYNYYYYEKQYTYLQIPVIFGYDFLNKGNWSLGVRAGPVMSVLLKSKVLTGEYDPGKDMVININNITPERIQLNWQAMGGINAAFSFSRRFAFELEPNIRYYFNSVYERNDISEKPWSAGFRVAFMIKF